MIRLGTITRRGALRGLGLTLGASALGIVPLGSVRAGEGFQDGTSRQVTIFSIIADPKDRTVDKKLAEIETSLKRYMPGHGFRLIDVRSRRLGLRESVACSIEGGETASAELTNVADAQGKVQVRVSLQAPGLPPYLSTIVTTPPNQIFFCDKELGDGRRLLIGIGAR